MDISDSVSIPYEIVTSDLSQVMRLDQFNKSSSLKKSQPTIFTHPSPSSKLPSMSWSNITQSFFFTGDVNVPTSHDQPRGCKMIGLLQYVHVYWICPGPVLFSRKKKRNFLETPMDLANATMRLGCPRHGPRKDLCYLSGGVELSYYR